MKLQEHAQAEPKEESKTSSDKGKTIIIQSGTRPHCPPLVNMPMQIWFSQTVSPFFDERTRSHARRMTKNMLVQQSVQSVASRNVELLSSILIYLPIMLQT